MLPLDGGNVLLTLGEWISKGKGQLISRVISLLVALGITSLALSWRSIWIAILGLWFVYINGSVLIENLKTNRDQKIRPARTSPCQSCLMQACPLRNSARAICNIEALESSVTLQVVRNVVRLSELMEAKN